MFAAQDKQSEQKRIVEFLARESNLPIDEVARIYEDERAELAVGARFTSFIPVFAIRNTQEILRQRSFGKSKSSSEDLALLVQ